MAAAPRVAESVIPPKIHFEDISAQAGLDFEHVAGDPRHKTYIIETTGSGVATFDYDGDGLLDIFFVNGSRWNERGAAASNRLFRNLGKLRFEDVTKKTGLVRTGWGQGVCAGDYDNDGDDDLFVTYYGPDVLYENRGDGTFRDVSEAVGLPSEDSRWSSGCAFFDYDRDGLLDLAVANYIQFDPETTPKPGENDLCQFQGQAVVCGPRGLPGGTNILYHQRDGKFVDVSHNSGFDNPSSYYGFSVLTGDFDGDGWVDVYIACDSAPSILFRNNHDGTFSDIGLLSGTALNEHGKEQGGMGADSADYNGDGLPDIIKTNFTNDIPSLYRNDGDGIFTDVTERAGLAVNTHFVGWGVAFLDLEHDGRQDLLMVNGHVYRSAAQTDSKGGFRQSKNVYWNAGGGVFLDVSSSSGPAIEARTAARGAAFADLDNDGSIEVVVNNLDTAPSLLVNRAEKQNWIRVTLRGRRSNRSGFGSRVTVTSGGIDQTKEVRSGGSFLSHNDTRLHFGLGEAEKADCFKVRWASGKTESFPGTPTNRDVVLFEGQGDKRE